MSDKISIPVYEKIAIDIANRIYKGDFKIGEKLHGRSTLASEYNVSPETIRKAVKLLEDVNILQSTRGSGIEIISKENALKFINNFSKIETIKELQAKINTYLEERTKLDNALIESVNKLFDYTSKLKNTNPLVPIEIEIPSSCKYIGKTISDIKFWQNTGATVVGIKRNGELIISPGPYATIMEKDILLIIGDNNVYERTLSYLNE